jgi:hypothetical protein
MGFGAHNESPSRENEILGCLAMPAQDLDTALSVKNC